MWTNVGSVKLIAVADLIHGHNMSRVIIARS